MSCLIVAEISANHNNDLDLALKTVQAALDSGADAIKVQTFKPESLSLDLNEGVFGPKSSGPWEGWRPWDLYKKASMPYEWHFPIKQLCAQYNRVFFSTPFDLEGVDFLEKLGVSLYKIASFEINDLPLISKVASTKKPLIISTGVATKTDISNAINTCWNFNNNNITLLKCTSEYPASAKDANLRKMLDMKRRFQVDIGLSDHSEGFIVPVAAVALGATIVEKHFVLDRSLGGLDANFSMEPHEFSKMVSKIRQVEQTLGVVDYSVDTADEFRKRSLFAIKPIAKGELFSKENIKPLRPNIGLAPRYFESLVGKYAKRDYKIGDPLLDTDLDFRS